MRMNLRSSALLALWLFAGASAGQSPATLAAGYEALARAETPGFAGFSAARGERLFQSTHANDWTCASCHTRDPRATGRHATTGKPLAPLAPAANSDRFTRLDKAEKWFRRNCSDVLGRPCTAREKGDVLTYLISLKP